MSDPQIARSLDVVGLSCPLPVLKARKALTDLDAGAVLEVLSSDPGAADDFVAFCRAQGHHLLAAETQAAVHRFLIRKGGPER